MIKKILSGAVWFIFLYCCGCKSNGNSTPNDFSNTAETKTPVTTVIVSRQSMQNEIWLNATSTILNKSLVKSTVTGYIIKSSLRPGQYVKAGQTLFVLKTKEAQVIGDMLPDSLKFSGKINISASQSGYISQLNHQQGDYVQDGEQLCVIANRNSFVFLLQVPFEFSIDIKINSYLEMKLPDERRIEGRVASRMPSLDSVSQTQQYLLRTDLSLQLPENLIAKVKIITNSKQQAQVLPKAAVLSDESQSDYWVMKLINDSTAVKVPVKKGMEDSTQVEILTPQFPPGTEILNTGNYGLPDTALVRVQK